MVATDRTVWSARGAEEGTNRGRPGADGRCCALLSDTTPVVHRALLYTESVVGHTGYDLATLAISPAELERAITLLIGADADLLVHPDSVAVGMDQPNEKKAYHSSTAAVLRKK